MSHHLVRPSRLVTTLSALAAAAAISIAGLRADIAGFGNTGSGFTLNSGATVSNGTLTLTDGGTQEARSAFASTPQPIAGFNVSFTYHESAALAAAGEGIAFVVERDTRGATAVGQSGTLLGYGGTNAIIPSAAVEFNLVNVGGVTASNTSFGTNGALTGNPVNNLAAGVNLGNGDNIRVNLSYNGSTLTETLTDLATNATSPTYSYDAGNLAAALGSDTAYVGFTGSTSALTPATQTISDFTFTAVPESGAWGSAGGAMMLVITLLRLRPKRARTCPAPLRVNPIAAPARLALATGRAGSAIPPQPHLRVGRE